MTKLLNTSTNLLEEMSYTDLLNYKKNLINQIFEIDTPLNEEETRRLELLSNQCDIVDAVIDSYYSIIYRIRNSFNSS